MRRYRGELLRASRRVLSDARAEDALQQAFLKAHEALLRNGPPDRLRPWLHRIALNSSLDVLAEDDAIALPPEEQLGSAESAAEAHERRERLRSTLLAIQSLPESQRRAIVAREFEGRSHEEIAAELGLSGGAARQLIHRARAGMRSAATALTPVGVLDRLLAIGGAQGAPVADIAAAGAGGGVAAKLAVAALVAGGVIGGTAAVGPLEKSEGEREVAADAERRGDGVRISASTGSAGDPAASSDGPSGPGGSGDTSGPGEEGGGGSGANGGGDSEGSKGPSESGEDPDDEEDDSEDEFEPDDDDGSESESSGSGSSGGGSSGSSGSGSSGSGSSDSGSSGSGSGDVPEAPDAPEPPEVEETEVD